MKRYKIQVKYWGKSHWQDIVLNLSWSDAYRVCNDLRNNRRLIRIIEEQ